MSRITVNETVTRSVSFENGKVEIQTALVRIFQLLEERRFKEAHIIIEQLLNIAPNNTDANVANFLYQFDLACVEEVADNFKNCLKYEESVFYKRIKKGSETELSKNLDFCMNCAREKYQKFNLDEEVKKQCAEEDLLLFKWIICIVLTAVIVYFLF